MADRALCNVCLDGTPPNVNPRGCSRCHGVGAKYCSKDCQQKDWSIHKIFCNMSPAVDAAVSNNAVQALFFPQDSTVPVMVSIKVRADLSIVDVSQYLPGNLGTDVKCYTSEQFPQYQEIDYRLDCGFSLLYYTAADSENMPENQSMRNVMTGHAKVSCHGEMADILGKDYWKELLANQKKWKGPLLLVKTDRFKKKGSSFPIYEDFEISDVKYLVLYLGFLSNIATRM